MCADYTLTCQAGRSCHIDCSAPQSCQSATINGLSATDLTISCDDTNACDALSIYCGSSDCTLQCLTTNACSSNIAVLNHQTTSPLQCIGLCPPSFTTTTTTTSSSPQLEKSTFDLNESSYAVGCNCLSPKRPGSH